MEHTLPPRYGSSAEDENSPGETGKSLKPGPKKKSKKHVDPDHQPLGAGSGDDDPDEDSMDLNGIHHLNPLGEKGPKKRPATKKAAMKKPAVRGRAKDWCAV